MANSLATFARNQASILLDLADSPHVFFDELEVLPLFPLDTSVWIHQPPIWLETFIVDDMYAVSSPRVVHTVVA